MTRRREDVQPRYHTPRTPGRPSYGGAVARLAEGRGHPFMPWQRRGVDVALEVVEDPTSPRGWSWAYRIVIVTVPRQAGKTTLLGDVNLHRCLLCERARTWLTAQTRQDARDTWMDVASDVTQGPLGRLFQVRRSNGSEALTTPNGSTFRVFAPTEDALHGKANELVTVDEAWAFDALQGAALDQAIIPTFTTTGGQLWIVSTAGHGLSEWLLGYIDRGRAAIAADTRGPVCFIEYGVDPQLAPMVAEGLSGQGKARRRAFDAILATHPGSGYTLREDVLDQAASAMAPGEFLRAYGNLWTRTAERTIPDHLWEASAVREGWTPPDPGNLALTFDVNLDRQAAVIAAAWRDQAAGPIRTQVIDHQPGTSWVVPRFRELADRWRPAVMGYDRAGPAVDVADELERGGLDLVGLTGREFAVASVGFLAALGDRRLEHHHDPALDDAIANATTRPMGDGAWVWTRRGSTGSIAALTAATTAVYLYDHRPTPAAAPVIAVRRGRRSVA